MVDPVAVSAILSGGMMAIGSGVMIAIGTITRSRALIIGSSVLLALVA